MLNSELEQPATKEDLKQFATKLDMKILKTDLETQIIWAVNRIVMFMFGLAVLVIAGFKLL